MFSILKFIYKLIMYPFRRVQPNYRRLIYFFLPNIKSFIEKKIQYEKNPSFQQKVIIRGQGNVNLGNNCSFGYSLGGFNKYGTIEIQPRYFNSSIKIGSNVSTNNNIMLCAANYIEIGDNTLIGQYVIVMDHEAHGIEPDKRREIGKIGKVIIGNNVWIGNNVTVLKNSRIGDNSIIATGAVVSGDFPNNVIIGGVPAKIIKNI